MVFMANFLKQLSSLHASLTSPQWLRSSLDWKYQIGALVLVLLAGMINFEIRDSQWTHWEENPNIHFLGDTPMVSTTDAAYFLSHARDYQQGAKLGAYEATRSYPDHTEAYRAEHDPYYQPKEDRPTTARDIPLLSVLITKIADIFTDGNLLLAGNLMIPFSVFLTAVSIGVMFWLAGYPAEGAVAGVGLGMSSGFMVRTSIGRIDTDQLLIFFLALCLSFVLLAMRERNLARLLAYSLLTALAVSLSYWWHDSRLFIVVVPFVMAGAILLHQRNIRHAALSFGAFGLAMNPIFFAEQIYIFAIKAFERATGLSFSASSAGAESTLIFPNTLNTITELARLDIFGTLATMTPYPALGVIGAIGFLIWVAFNPSRGLVFLPFFIMGLLSVIAGRRFAFFGTAFVWFGLAWLFMSSARWAAMFATRRAEKTSFSTDGTVLALAAAAVIGTAAISHVSFMPRPTFPVSITQSLQSLKPVTQPEGGVLASWWDYGYYAHYHSGLDVYHDGGTQQSPRTHLIARGLTSSNTDELIQILKFVTTEGNKGINENKTDLLTLNKAIAAAKMPEKPLYLMVTDQMVYWMGSIATLGRFNVETGQGMPADRLQQYGVTNLICGSIGENRFKCRRGLLDLNHGTLDGKPLISEIVVIKGGFVQQVDTLKNRSPFKLLLIVGNDGRAVFQLIHRAHWNTSFQALYNRGEYNPQRMELVLDDFPIARVYRILQ